jgi:sugar lactone lactonase YvrE
VAGGGSGGDGGAAVNASLNCPMDVACDAAGNFYIADKFNSRVRVVSTNGIITTVAGGASSFQDNVPATNSALGVVEGVTIDRSGNLYIADYGAKYIQKVDTNGIITTVAGNGIGNYSGDGGPATNASLIGPSGVACDAVGNVYFADRTFDAYFSGPNNNRVRKVDTNGIITTVAGGASVDTGNMATNASLNMPSKLTFDAVGNLYIADTLNGLVRKVDTNGIITTIAGGGSGGDGGPATEAGISPCGLAFDRAGNLYIGDWANGEVRKVDTSGIITTVAGGGSGGPGGAATNANLFGISGGPEGVAFDKAGNLFIADPSNNHVYKVLMYAAYPTFTLNSVSADNAGDYTVVVSNPNGCATSQVAALTVATSNIPPQIIVGNGKPGFQTNGFFGVTTSGAVGQTNVIDGSTNLVNWSPLFTNVVGSTPSFFFDSSSTNYPWRFYRARSP